MKPICIILPVMFFVFSARADEIKRVNALVERISDSIRSGEYSIVEIEEIAVMEGKRPELSFYHFYDTLRAVHVTVGHETWKNDYWYYFKDYEIIKFLKVTEGRPDKPPRKARIYADGKVIWENTDMEIFAPEELLSVFRSIQKTRRAFSGYSISVILGSLYRNSSLFFSPFSFVPFS